MLRENNMRIFERLSPSPSFFLSINLYDDRRSRHVVSFFFHWLNDQTYMCAHLGDLNIRKNLSLGILAEPEIRPIRSFAIRRAYHETTKARAFARVLRTGRRTRKTRGLSCRKKPQIHSKFPDDHVERFARPHPAVMNVQPYMVQINSWF